MSTYSLLEKERKKINVSYIESILNHSFEDVSLIYSALTHPSATEGLACGESYQRLEFLGDSILGVIVSQELFNRFPEFNEGQLTRIKTILVSGETLSKVAKNLRLDTQVVYGLSEKSQYKRSLKHTLEDIFEALIASLYLDAGFEKAQEFVLRMLDEYIHPDLGDTPTSPKSMLQQIVQYNSLPAPVYETINQKGPAHDPVFTCAVLVEDKVLATGTGSSKKIAQTIAAQHAINKIIEQQELEIP